MLSDMKPIIKPKVPMSAMLVKTAKSPAKRALTPDPMPTGGRLDSKPTCEIGGHNQLKVAAHCIPDIQMQLEGKEASGLEPRPPTSGGICYRGMPRRVPVQSISSYVPDPKTTLAADSSEGETVPMETEDVVPKVEYINVDEKASVSVKKEEEGGADYMVYEVRVEGTHTESDEGSWMSSL